MRLTLFLLLAAVIACPARMTKTVGTTDTSEGVSTATPPDSAVYAALMSSVYQGGTPDTIVLRDSSVKFTDPLPIATVSSWRQEFEELPPELVARLIEVSRVRRSPLTLGLGKKPIRIWPPAYQKEAGVSNKRDVWAELDSYSPNARGILAPSPIAFSADGTQALVYYDYVCGPRCGHGGLKWLESTANGDWKVRKTLIFRIL